MMDLEKPPTLWKRLRDRARTKRKNMTPREKQMFQMSIVLNILTWAISAIALALYGRILHQHWMYVGSGVLGAIALGLVWEFRHPFDSPDGDE